MKVLLLLLFVVFFITTTIAMHCALCRALRQRSIAVSQPFQLPVDTNVEQEALIQLVERLRGTPWLLVNTRVRDGWLDVDAPQPYTQSELEEAFGCSF